VAADRGIDQHDESRVVIGRALLASLVGSVVIEVLWKYWRRTSVASFRISAAPSPGGRRWGEPFVVIAASRSDDGDECVPFLSALRRSVRTADALEVHARGLDPEHVGDRGAYQAKADQEVEQCRRADGLEHDRK
jgi:hypothetical protein